MDPILIELFQKYGLVVALVLFGFDKLLNIVKTMRFAEVSEFFIKLKTQRKANLNTENKTLKKELKDMKEEFSSLEKELAKSEKINNLINKLRDKWNLNRVSVIKISNGTFTLDGSSNFFFTIKYESTHPLIDSIKLSYQRKPLTGYYPLLSEMKDVRMIDTLTFKHSLLDQLKLMYNINRLIILKLEIGGSLIGAIVISIKDEFSETSVQEFNEEELLRDLLLTKAHIESIIEQYNYNRT